ncbi:MAG: TIM barrel protein [Gammaproteobacteria bacterium]|jgi:hydroxypyruvate isomerase|nr:TIM barrel protein [Gammaproteobacteria bacterium]
MPKFSANLGFLWPELSLPEAIYAAKQAGFEAVECHFPYAVPASAVAAALEATGLPMLGLNTRLGINGPDDFGVMAMPGRELEAREYVNEAIAYAAAIKCRNINCVPGKTGGTTAAEAVYRQNLDYACSKAAEKGIGILIEPINQRDAPGYHFSLVEQGLTTIQAVGADNLGLMFDCYHTQIMQGDLITRLKQALPYIGHVQFAAVPDRGEPDTGEVNFPWLLAELETLGWQGFIGAEYRPRSTTDKGLGWMQAYR